MSKLTLSEYILQHVSIELQTISYELTRHNIEAI